MNLHSWSLFNWCHPRAPDWLPSEYRPEVETFSGWRAVFANERALMLDERKRKDLHSVVDLVYTQVSGNECKEKSHGHVVRVFPPGAGHHHGH